MQLQQFYLDMKELLRDDAPSEATLQQSTDGQVTDALQRGRQLTNDQHRLVACLTYVLKKMLILSRSRY